MSDIAFETAKLKYSKAVDEEVEEEKVKQG
jgi:hypothetical protein